MVNGWLERRSFVTNARELSSRLTRTRLMSFHSSRLVSQGANHRAWSNLPWRHLIKIGNENLVRIIISHIYFYLFFSLCSLGVNYFHWISVESAFFRSFFNVLSTLRTLTQNATCFTCPAPVNIQSGRISLLIVPSNSFPFWNFLICNYNREITHFSPCPPPSIHCAHDVSVAYSFL